MPRKPREVMRLDQTLSRLELATAVIQAASNFDLSTEEGKVAKVRHLNLAERLKHTSHENISTIAQEEGVSFKTLIRYFKEMKQMEGIVKIASHLPQVLEDTAFDAKAHERTCESCFGEGFVSIPPVDGKKRKEVDTQKCIICEGTGKIRIPGDKDARKMVLEIMELVGQNKSLTVNAQGGKVLFTDQSLEETLKSARQEQRQIVIEGEKLQ